MKNLLSSKRFFAYAGIFLVVFIWGVYPLTIRLLYNYYSATVLKVFGGIVATLSLLLICRKKLKLLSRDYFKVALPCGLFYALGEVLQTIGFQYTTPATGSFLENLSCITVPILMFLFIRQKPTWLKLLAVLCCLSSTFLLSMTQSEGTNLPVGILLCALAGIFYGVNIAGTGVYAKKLDPALYVMLQMGVLTLVSTLTTLTLQLWPLLNGGTPETLKFTLDPLILILAAVHAIVISVVCWIIRTAAMKQVDASVVAVIMPFSAVVTGVLSLLLGKDTLSPTFIGGAILGLAAIFLSGIGDSLSERQSLADKR